MEYMDLSEAKRLMKERDWYGGQGRYSTDEKMVQIHLGLADLVPDLVAEVEKLRGPFTCKHDPKYAGAACADRDWETSPALSSAALLRSNP